MGAASLQYKFVGCASEPIEFPQPQSTVAASYVVPAHKIEVRVISIQGHTQATAALRDSPVIKDLTNVNEEETEERVAESTQQELSGVPKTEQPDELSLVRFQYDGILNVRPVIDKDLAGENCPYRYTVNFPGEYENIFDLCM